MIGQALDNSLIAPSLAMKSNAQLSAASGSKFEDLMRVSTDRIDLEGKSKQEQLENLTNQFVSVAFIKPMLEKMRDSPFKSDLFSGGPAGDTFQQHLDTILSDRISQRSNFPIARVMYGRMMGEANSVGQQPGELIGEQIGEQGVADVKTKKQIGD